MKGNSRVSKVNVILVSIAIVSVIITVIMINLPKLRAQIEKTLKSSETIENSYAEETTNQVDISKNGDGSVIATLAEDGTLTIYGSGEMKDFSSSESIKDILSSTEITKVVIQEGVTNIGKNAFRDCRSLTSIENPSTVKSIGYEAFYRCYALISINIPEGVTSIGDRAFIACTSLRNVKIPSTLTSIGNNVFDRCSSLTSIEIPEGVTSIGQEAFYECSSLENLEIPSSVTSIGDWVFSGCSSLTSVNIPEGVTSIGGYAFLKCSSLTEIKVDDNNQKYMDDNGVLYTKDKTEIIKYPDGKEGNKYTILEGVTKIGGSAFSGCSSLAIINIPKDVTSIGSSAFSRCSNLERINIPEGVISIGSYTFQECSRLTSINIPEGVTIIEHSAFSGCSSLTLINIPSSVTSIGEKAFYNCSSITMINIPSSITDIGKQAFYGCSSLLEINVDENNKNYMDDEGVLYTKDKTEIIKYPPKKEGIEYMILGGVTSIGDEAFYRCYNLTSINIPEGVTSIGGSAFYYCSNLARITMPSSVTSIGYSAFWGCYSLESINIPEGVTSIGSYAFNGAVVTKSVIKSEEIIIPELLQRTQNQDDILYSSTGLSLTNCTIEGNVVTIDENKTYAEIKVKDGCLKGLKYIICYFEWDISEKGDESVIATLAEDGTLTISGTGNMKDWKYSNESDWYMAGVNTKIKTVNINIGITNIGSNAFYNCSNLTSINIPSTVTSIGDYTFYNCSSLTNINIPEGVTSIGSGSFSRCASLTEIKVDEKNTEYIDDNGVLYTKDKTDIIKYPPKKEGTEYVILEGITSIIGSAFSECSSLTSITIPSTVTSIGSSAFSGCSGLTIINVPNNVTSIGDYAFYNCSRLTSINIPEGVTSIKQQTFEGCSSLTEINIPEGVKEIGVYAFKGCDSLKSITIPSSVTSIGNVAFSGCSSLTSINIPKGVTSIEQATFEGCNSLTRINIPDGVTTIGYRAFDGCTSLAEVIISEGVTTIGDDAFRDCSSLTSIMIPNSVTSIGSALLGCYKVTIVCKSDSTAQTYAIDNSIHYQIDDDSPIVNFSTNGTESPVKGIETTITVEDELAGLVEKSIKYIWSTQSENITKEQIVNSFENGETLNRKDVTGTYYLWIYAKDNLGNESIVRSKAFVLDNTPPTVQESYSTTELTNQNVTVTITANEEVQNIEGWTISEDKKVLTKEYTQNTTETENIIVKDIAGNEKQVEVKISNIDKVAPTLQLSYSTTNPTNQKITVTIKADEEIQAIEGWTLSEDKKILTKEYSENAIETIIVKDIAGNEVQQIITISNIDKTAPIVIVEYLVESEEYMKVTITANEEVQAVDDWTLSQDKKVLTKEYNQNIKETVTIKDIAGNEATVEIKVTQVKGILKENTYEIKDSYITKIKSNTTYEDIIKNIQTTRQYKITENNKEVTGTTLIKTGQKLTVNNKTYTLVVTGDVNGDGKTNIVDLSRLKLAIVGKVALEGEYKEAADVNSNGQPLQLTDLSKMKLYIIGKTSI